MKRTSLEANKMTMMERKERLMKVGDEVIFKTNEEYLMKYDGSVCIIQEPKTESEIKEQAAGAVYKVRFPDGKELDAFNTELKSFDDLGVEDVYKLAKSMMHPEDIDHHGNGYGMDDLYLRKNKISQKIVSHLPKSLLSQFKANDGSGIWFDIPFAYTVIENE